MPAGQTVRTATEVATAWSRLSACCRLMWPTGRTAIEVAALSRAGMEDAGLRLVWEARGITLGGFDKLEVCRHGVVE